jgi:hypothetical protein
MQNIYLFVGSANHTSPTSHVEEGVSCRSGLSDSAAGGEVAESEREVIVKTARCLGFSKNEAGGLVAALEVEAAGAKDD